ncbi:MAG: hypothetical protein JNL83_34030 [Myxococcales bacterium]|nr:hypothetical protein [Myxococcales bacterium]
MRARAETRYTDEKPVQYSLRSRRRLRPATGELLPQQVTAARARTKDAPAPAPVLAEGTGATRNVLLDRPVIERVLPRARRDSWQR